MDYEAENENNTLGNTRKETDKKCRNCGGTLDYNPATGRLHCPYCDSEFDIEPEQDEEEQTCASEQDFEDAEFTENFDWGASTKTIICKSCGGETIYDELTLSSVCPYCGSNQVMEVDTKKTMQPAGVVPFKVDKKTAGEKFKAWIKKKWFCPGAAKKSAQPDSFTGVYVPMWTFDTDTTTEYSGRYGIDRTYTDSDGNTHTTTDWYRVSGTHREFIDDHPVLATDRYDTKMFNGLLPFDTANNVIFKPEYIAGFAAEKYSVGLKDGWERAKTSITALLKRNIEAEVKREHHADRADISKMATDFAEIKYKYLLVPIWISSFRYKEKIYNFMVNGETGKTSGKTPISPWKVALVILLILAFIALIFWLNRNG
ncbi:MAG: hypothetical protein II777_10380 [Clostridia bacterium]|nr:hypothetical protein [Clostridia bacterium]